MSSLSLLSAFWGHNEEVEGSRQTMDLPVPWSWAFQTPEFWEINLCYLSHSIYDIFVTSTQHYSIIPKIYKYFWKLNCNKTKIH